MENKLKILEYNDAITISNILKCYIRFTFDAKLSKEIIKSDNSCVIMSFGVLLENIKNCIISEIELNNTDSNYIKGLAEAEFLINCLINKYDLDNLDFKSSRKSFNLLCKDFNEFYEDKVMHINYKGNKLRVIICSSILGYNKWYYLIATFGVDIVLIMISIAMLIIQMRVYGHIMYTLLFGLLLIVSLIGVVYNYIEYKKKY